MNEEDISEKLVFKRHITLFICIALAVATLLIYWQVHAHEFINYDDTVYVTENRHVRYGLTPGNMLWAFTSTQATNWHPLTWLSHMLDCQLFGMDAGRHHIISVLLHVASTVLLFLVFQRMTGYAWRSAFVAALFAVHPLHVESVAWIAERKDVLSTLFWMLTMWSYVRYAERPVPGRYLLTLLFFVLGLMAKPMLVTLPFVLLLLDYWPLGRIGAAHAENGLRSQMPIIIRLVREKIPFFILSCASSVITVLVQKGGGAMGTFEAYPLGVRIANAIVSYGAYLLYVVWPFNLGVFYPHPIVRPWWQVAGTAALFIFPFLLMLKVSRRHGYIVTGLLWYVGTLIPVIGLVQVGSQSMADRYTYVPLIGIFMVIAWGVPELLEGFRYRRIGLASGGVVSLLLLGAIAFRQISYWADSITLFERTLQIAPDNNEVARLNLGMAFAKENRFDEAVEVYTEGLQLKPNSSLFHGNMGFVLSEMGKLERAIEHFNRGLAIDPESAELHNNLAFALEKLGERGDAVRHYREALRISPMHADARLNLGMALAAQGKYDEALKIYSEGLHLDPDSAQLQTNLGIILTQRGEFQRAIEYYERALRLAPDLAPIHSNLAVALAKEGRFDEAVRHYNEALRIDPDYSNARNNLFSLITNRAHMLTAEGNIPDAVRHYADAVRLKPDSASARNRLGNLLVRMNKVDEARAEFVEAVRLEPGNPVLRYNLGNAYRANYQLNEAIAQYEEALKIEPAYLDALNNLARTYGAKGEYERALSLYMKMIEMQPENFVGYYNIACVYSLQNKVDESAKWLEKAIERGFSNWGLLRTDEELQNLRQSPGFQDRVFP